MDIAQDPTLPTGNPERADAAQAPAVPLTIRREDYRPPAWLVPEVSLDFTLALDSTRVATALQVRRNPVAVDHDFIRLNGDGLVPLAVTLDGVPAQDWTMEGGDLLVPLTGEAHEIVVETVVDPTANSQLMGLYASGGMLCTQCERSEERRVGKECRL